MIFKRVGWFEDKCYNVEVKALPHDAILLKADREWVYDSDEEMMAEWTFEDVMDVLYILDMQRYLEGLCMR